MIEPGVAPPYTLISLFDEIRGAYGTRYAQRRSEMIK